MKRFNLLYLTLTVIAFMTVSCSEEYLDNSPKSTVSSDQLSELAETNPEASLTLSTGLETGNYNYLVQFNTGDNGGLHDDFGHMAVNLGTDLMSNDVVMTQSHWFSNYYNYTARVQTSSRTDMVWQFYYKVIRNVNDALPLTPATSTSPEVLQIRGRLLAMRGFAYFYLLQIYAYDDIGVPIYTEDTQNLGRAPVADVKALIEQDLTEAYDLVAGYQRSSKMEVDQNVAAGILARYYLWDEQYGQAATYAQIARGGYAPMDNNGLVDGFSRIDNSEWMWGADINTSTSTIYASFFSHMSNLNEGYAGLLQVYKTIDSRLFNQIPDSDARKEWFLDSGNSFGLPQYANIKFFDESGTSFVGDYVFMRAAEMYLIEAEARAQSGDESGARQVLFDLISTRDSEYDLSANSGQALLDEIKLHRRIELWGEGFAWYDMKRWDVALNRTYPGTNHATFGQLDYAANSDKFKFQIPQAELNANTEIEFQNPF